VERSVAYLKSHSNIHKRKRERQSVCARAARASNLDEDQIGDTCYDVDVAFVNVKALNTSSSSSHVKLLI
jgi:hypothetical protein